MATASPDTIPQAVAAFHARALALLNELGDTPAVRDAIRRDLETVALEPGLIAAVALDRLHASGTMATILREAADGRAALMLLYLPPDAPTPIHNHNSWGVACVVQGRNRYWRWERTDDGDDPGRADVRLVEEFVHGPGESVLWPDPPQDLHAQQGEGGPAWELVFFGRNPNRRPRAYFDPETGRVTYADATDRPGEPD